MKKLLFLFVGLFVGTAAMAQNGLGFGLKAGVNFPKYNFSGSNSDYETNSSTNFHVTGFLDAPLGRNFSVQPGISLQGKGAELINSSLGTVTQNTMWLEVPVNLVAKVPMGYSGNFFIGAGPYIGFGLSGKNKYDSDWGSTEQEFEFGSDGDLKSIDFGVNFIAGFHLGQRFMIHAGHGLGLTDIRASNNEYFPDDRLTSRVWTVGLGFGL
ncbi:MAG TPA: porin family protein [Sphingobacteriaceae bacterium]|nr:porin family protein [Sphingobacteriaceae bacterium]